MPYWRAARALLVIGCSLSCLPAAAAATADSFYSVIRNNDLGNLRQLIRDQGVHARDTRGTSPLMYAAGIGSLDAMKLLVDAGSDVNASNGLGATPLMWCAGDIAKVRYLLSKGASVTSRSKAGRTPLMIAATYDGSVEIVRLMIQNGADVKAKDESGGTALESAAYVNNLDAARVLLDKGADPNTADQLGFTPLCQAAFNGDRNSAMVKLLLDHGAAVNVVTGEAFEVVKNGPLRLGYLTPLLLAVPQANFSTVELLVKAGADVKARDKRGMNALSLAVATDHADPRIVRLLLAKGADPASKSVDGKTALDWARKYRDPEILRALGIQAGTPAAERDPATVHRSVEAAIEAGAGLLQRTSASFLEKGGCPSCHAQHMTGLAVAAASAAHVKVDWSLETAQSRVTASLRGALEQDLFQVIDPAAGVDSQQFSLMQMAEAGIPASLPTDSLVFHIAAMQRKEGDWPNYSFARPPLEDGGFSHTAKGIRSLTLYGFPGRKAEFDGRIARAAEWIEKAAPRTTEDRSMQLLGLRWANRVAPRERVQELIAEQRSNGGWGQTPNLPPDAYATGEALIALHEAGLPATDPAYRRGVDYLLRTQMPDGSWHVITRAAGFQPYFESGFPYHHDQWISQAGTAFAIIALSHAIPAPAATAAK